MTRQERVDLGEKIFIGAIVGSIVIEVLLTVFAITLNPSWNTPLPWLISVLGAVSVVFLLYLANWLYSGNLTAWKTALGFAALQIVLAGGVLYGMSSSPSFAAYLGAPLFWLALILLIAYIVFAICLGLPRPVHEFLSARRGETIPEDTAPAPAPAAEVITPSPVLPLTDDQAEAFGSLGTWMQTAGCLLIVAGVLRFFVGLTNIPLVLDWKQSLPGLPSLLQGIVAIVLGIIVFAPAAALKVVQGRVTERLLDAFKRLRSLYFLQLILLAIAVAGVVVGIAAAFM
jgi:hypothetical protein